MFTPTKDQWFDEARKPEPEDDYVPPPPKKLPWAWIGGAVLVVAVAFGAWYSLDSQPTSEAPAPAPAIQAEVAPPAPPAPVVAPPATEEPPAPEPEVAATTSAPARNPGATARTNPPRTPSARSSTATSDWKPPKPDVVVPGAAKMGRFSISTSPAGAQVYLDKKLIGTTPISGREYPAGEYVIKIQKEGYNAQMLMGEVKAGGDVNLGSFTLESAQ